MIRTWLQGLRHLIETYFIPRYSPKLNAAEYVWQETRKWASHNRFFGLLTDLKNSLFRRFNRFQGNTAWSRNIVPFFA